MREECRKFDALLRDAGWCCIRPATPGEVAVYAKAYNGGKDVVGIEVALEEQSLGAYGHYGVCAVCILKFDADWPLYPDDFREMQELIWKAEGELLKAQIPFRPSYGFGRHLEHCLGKNYELRDRNHLAQYEKEDFE